MKAPARLGLYGLGLVIVFIVAGFTANAVVPEETAQNWVDETAQANQHGEGNMTDASGQEERHPLHSRWASASPTTDTSSPTWSPPPRSVRKVRCHSSSPDPMGNR